MNSKQILKSTRAYVTGFYTTQFSTLPYHNLSHTMEVVRHVKKLARAYGLSKNECFLLETAAWFHDLGIAEGCSGHELNSAKSARAFLEEQSADDATIRKVTTLILVTRQPQKPQNLSEEIICDADLCYLGKKYYPKKNELLRQENALVWDREVPENEWFEQAITTMKKHRFFTDRCRSKLKDQKIKNITYLQNQLSSVTMNPSETTEQAGKKKSGVTGRPEKGIETMFRITSSNNQRLSDMADNKAHILITVNSIILSVMISVVLRKLDDYSFMSYPTFLLLAVSLSSITFSILATRPSIPKGTFEPEELENKQVNLLFFGNFYKVPIEQYKTGMMMLMEDSEFLYQTLIRDVHGQGVVLGKKYHLLRAAYNIFMFGLIITIVLFIIASVFHQPLQTHQLEKAR